LLQLEEWQLRAVLVVNLLHCNLLLSSKDGGYSLKCILRCESG
jgi:hypothetical protein